MAFVCCGIKYSKNDPQTYWCIDTFINKPVQKKSVGQQKVVKEVVDTLTCKKNGCIKVNITRYGKFRGYNKLLEIENLSGHQAVEYLQKTINSREKQPLVCPVKNIPQAKNIDLCYGKVINSTTQKARYLNEKGFADNNKIVNECITFKI